MSNNEFVAFSVISVDRIIVVAKATIHEFTRKHFTYSA